MNDRPLSFRSIPDSLTNPWNENKHVKIGFDGTEIEPSVGEKLRLLFHQQAQQQQPSYQQVSETTIVAPNGDEPFIVIVNPFAHVENDCCYLLSSSVSLLSLPLRVESWLIVNHPHLHHLPPHPPHRLLVNLNLVHPHRSHQLLQSHMRPATQRRYQQQRQRHPPMRVRVARVRNPQRPSR